MNTAAQPLHALSALLMAGGHSRRMGQDKALLEWRGRPLGEHQASTLVRTGASTLLISCRRDQTWTPPGFARIEDRAEGGALDAFVGAFMATPSEVLLVLAVDLPLVTAEWLASLATRATTSGASVVPRRENTFEPFAAAWHRSALPVLLAALAQNQSLQQACADLRRLGMLEGVDVDAAEAASLVNLNTPEDLARVVASA